MRLFLIYIPFLFTQFQVQNSQIYTWQQYGLSLSAPANLTETKDEDTWEIEDENLDFWVDAQKFTFEEEEKEVVNGTAKNGAINAAKLMGYENVTDGGPIPNVPEGHFVITSDDGQDVYYIVILDRQKQIVFEIILETSPENKPKAYQLINSLRYK